MHFSKLEMEVSFVVRNNLIELSVIPPDTPVINTEMEDGNIVRIPAGSDYTVTCTSQGFPTPYVRWVDHQGNACFYF